jgi:hypothetical protein
MTSVSTSTCVDFSSGSSSVNARGEAGDTRGRGAHPIRSSGSRTHQTSGLPNAVRRRLIW